jgi:hypothetical protein
MNNFFSNVGSNISNENENENKTVDQATTGYRKEKRHRYLRFEKSQIITSVFI